MAGRESSRSWVPRWRRLEGARSFGSERHSPSSESELGNFIQFEHLYIVAKLCQVQ